MIFCYDTPKHTSGVRQTSSADRAVTSHMATFQVNNVFYYESACTLEMEKKIWFKDEVVSIVAFCSLCTSNSWRMTSSGKFLCSGKSVSTPIVSHLFYIRRNHRVSCTENENLSACKGVGQSVSHFFINVKVNLSLFLIKHHAMKT